MAYRDDMRDYMPAIAVWDGSYSVADYCWTKGDDDDELRAVSEVVVLAILDLLTEGNPALMTLRTYKGIENGINRRVFRLAEVIRDGIEK